MLRFVLHAGHHDTLAPYARRWAGELGRRIEIVSYDELFRATRVPRCVHVFADSERLNDGDRELAAQVWESIRRGAPDLKLMNHPLRSMCRYELLRTLHETGVNRFDVYRLTEARKPARFPVFLRGENDHAGPETGLIESQVELDAVVEALVRDGKSRGSRLVTEFCAERNDDGLYRKYGAFYIDGEVLPRHAMQSREWVVKADTRILNDAQWAEERRYLELNPHADWIRRVFEIARIDYGRIDYGVVDGLPQAYEINTNPTIIPAENSKLSPSGERFTAEFALALERLEATALAPRNWSDCVRLDRPIKSWPLRLSNTLLAKTLGAQVRRAI